MHHIPAPLILVALSIALSPPDYLTNHDYLWTKISISESNTVPDTPRAAVLIVPIDPNDRFFKLVVTLPDDKISDQPRLLNPEIDGSPDSASA